jgi:hypothetical protein
MRTGAAATAALLILTGQLGAQPFTISTESPAHIVVPGDVNDSARLGARRLAEYIQQVTGAAPVIVADTDPDGSGVSIVLRQKSVSHFRPDGYRIRTEASTGRDVISITAMDGTGLKYGCYRLIRELRQRGKRLEVPVLAVDANPWLKTRELFVAEIEWHPTPGEQRTVGDLRKRFDWQNWPIPTLERYVDLVDAMGYNSLMLSDGESLRRFSGNFITQDELTHKVQCMYERARRNGMGTSFFLWSQEGVKDVGVSRNSPHIPEQFADMQANWEALITKYGALAERWVMHWADPGGCKTRDCTINTPQAASNQFADLLREKGFQSGVSFSLWGLRWGAWPGFHDERTSVIDSGILNPRIGINLMRTYDAMLAKAIQDQHRTTGVWGWYTNDLETNPGMHVHTHILDNEFHQLDNSAAANLDWYSLEDNNHILNLPSLYVGAQMLWNHTTSADEALSEFCEAVWGREASKVRPALQAIAGIRCGRGQHMSGSDLWPHGYICRLGKGSASPGKDLAESEKAIAVLTSVRLDPEFVPKLPLTVEPGELIAQIQAQLLHIRDFARIRLAYQEALRPALEGGRPAAMKLRMSEIPALADTIPGSFGAGMESFQYSVLRKFADSWRHRTFDDNLALNARVTASSWKQTDPRFAPGQAVNGLLCDYREEGWAAGAYGPAWLKIDLGSVKPVRSVRIYNRGYQRDRWDNNLRATPASGQVFYAVSDGDPAHGTVGSDEPGYHSMGEFEGWPPTNDPASFREITVKLPVQARFLKILIVTTAGNEAAGTGEVEVR